MKDSTYQHVCSVLVGIATLFRFIGIDLATFTVTSLVHSAHQRDPSSIIDHAGYYGQAVSQVTSCLSMFIVPIVLNYMKPKWALVLGSALYAFYIACFFHINNYLFFLANVLLGVALTLNHTAFSMFQMQFSTRKSLARNSALVWGIAAFSLIFSGVLYVYVANENTASGEFAAIGEESYRYYSEEETRMMCAFLFAACVISSIIHSLLPNREVANSVTSENPHEKLTLKGQVEAIASILVNPYIVMLIPRFLNTGLLMSFYMNIYPTSLQFSTILADRYPLLTAYYGFALCAGTSVGSLVITPLNRAIHDFGLRPLYYITVGVELVAYAAAVLTVPNLSTAVPTAENAFFEPHVIWVCFITFLIGFADSTNAASSAVICSRLVPGRASHTYTAARFYMGVGSSIIFFCSPLLTMRMHAIVLVSITAISGLTFDLAVKQIEKRDDTNEKKSLPEI